MKPNHRDFTKWNHGNGLFHYAPNLTSASRDFAEGVRSAAGLKPGPEGLVLTAGSGEVVFDVFTPFIIVAKINDLDDPDDDAEASVVSLDAALPVTVSVSTDNGLSWVQAGRLEAGKGKLDLTPHVKGRYGYLLKLSVRGKPGSTAIRSLAIDTWVQVAPISLPRLKRGLNHCRYDASDRYGGLTMPMLVLPNVADPEDLKKYVVQMPKDYDLKRKTARIRGECIVKFAAPPGSKIAWLSVGGTFCTYQKSAAKNTANSIGYAIGEPRGFKQIWRSRVPTWVGHWRTNYDTDIRLSRPAEVVYVRYYGKPGLNVIRACLHLTPPRPHDPAVRITHGYKLDGKMVEKTIEMKRPGPYTIDCPGKVENVFIRIEKPST